MAKQNRITGILGKDLRTALSALIEWTPFSAQMEKDTELCMALFDDDALLDEALLLEMLSCFKGLIPCVLWLRYPDGLFPALRILDLFDEVFVCCGDAPCPAMPRAYTALEASVYDIPYDLMRSQRQKRIGIILPENAPKIPDEALSELSHWDEARDLQIWYPAKAASPLSERFPLSFSGYAGGIGEIETLPKVLINFSTPASKAETHQYAARHCYTVNAAEIDDLDLFLRECQDMLYVDRLVHRVYRHAVRFCTPAGQLRALWRNVLGRELELPYFSVIAATKRLWQLPFMLECYDRQTYPYKEMILLLHTDDDLDEAKKLLENRRDIKAFHMPPREFSFGCCMNFGVQQAEGDYIVKLDDDDYYGAEYLADAMDVFLCSGYKVIGKFTVYNYDEESGQMYLRHPCREYRTTGTVAGPTIIAHRSVFDDILFRDVPRAIDSCFLADCRNAQIKIFSAGKEDFMFFRSSSRGHTHTWSIDNRELNAVSMPITTHFNGGGEFKTVTRLVDI